MMNPMNPQEMERLRKAANVASVLDDILPEVDGMMKTTMNQVFAKMHKGELTPAEAMSYWYEMYSYHRLGQRLKTTASQAEPIIDRR